MSLQGIINTASNIEITRTEVVAQTVTRSGRVYTGRRDTVKPWQFKVTPAAYYPWDIARAALEGILAKDRYEESTISFSVSGQSWMFAYQGALTSSELQNNVIVTGATSRTITATISGTVLSKQSTDIIFAAGDLIQPLQNTHRYPYVVTENVTRGSTSSISIPVHRDIIGTLTGGGFRAGPTCEFKVLVTNLPSYNYLPGKLIQFSGDFQILENVV